MTSRLAVIGSINVDLVTYLRQMPGEGETIEAASFEMHHGGKGANQAVAAAKLGTDVLMVGKIGADVFGDNALANLEAQGIDTRHVARVTDVSTGVATILVEPSGDNRIMIVAGANGLLRPADIDAAADDLAQCDLILLQLEVPLDTVYHAIHFAVAHEKQVILNPAPVRAELKREYLQHVAFLVPNRTEVGQLAGRRVATAPEIEAAARALIPEAGDNTVIATMGGDGALVVTSRSSDRIEGVAVQPVDTTGAGDAFIGSFAHFYARSDDVLEAAQHAARYAADSITRRGAQSSYGDAAEFQAFTDQIGRHPAT